jgi:hypothetical protein
MLGGCQMLKTDAGWLSMLKTDAGWLSDAED